jgi:hypothetical protein
MPNYSWIPIAIGVLAIIAFALLLYAPSNKRLRKIFRESFFNNIGVPYRNFIGLLLGAIAALLLLTTHTWTSSQSAWLFLILVGITMLLLIAVRPNSNIRIHFFSWGVWVIIVLGFGFGALLYEARSWWIWLWNKYRLINEPHELFLEALFLLGVILGVFVVRNWGKDDKSFMESLAGFLGGTFLATVLGNVQDKLTPLGTNTYYLLGFTMSAAVNLLLAARFTANYTNKRSLTSRALLDFLYGSDRTKIIDSYFLKNFEEDPDYAKRFLQDTLLEYRDLAQREFAEKMNQRLRAQNVIIASPPSHCSSPPSQESRKFFYQLCTIQCEKKAEAIESPPSPLSVKDLDREYSVVYKCIDKDKSPITKDMFRVGVAMRHKDVLEYIVAPGEYQASFPYIGSVAGLSLIVRETIVMDRDMDKKFRSKDYRDGICPRDVEQWRGLDEIDFLSYISIPVVSRLGQSTENPLGVVNIDTKIFITDHELVGEAMGENMFRTKLSPNRLNEYASKLYDQEDKHVKYIEDLTKIIQPVLELYAKCRVGAI